ncbi:hypothetical protein FA95DRAFT_1572504 [Auriscalpium vulgare]|uniref:Uncharacterized protein n=1 Tax=Auriscalpium vulgare TaxID=40419 RepID=A0ACB8RV09_9AGAM|nr:hypothetical protein FA95DRAFT_1572504 [Auriscalpium vulgare]
MVTLSNDVHVEIIDWVYRNSQHVTIEYKTLCACSLVSKGWTAPSQRLLFRYIDCSRLRFSHIVHLLHALQGNPLLGTYVRFLEDALSSAVTWAAATNDTLALLALCPNLNALSLLVVIDLVSDVISVVKRMDGIGSQLKHLRIGGTPERIAPFIHLWPNLQPLEVYDSFGESDLSELSSPLKTPRSAVVNLEFLTIARWILEAADTSALRELDASGVDWDNLLCLDAFIKPALENLTTLFLDHSLPPQAVINRFVRLEKLVIAARPGLAGVVLPRTLLHVGYHAVRKDDRAPLRYLLDALQVLPVLRLITATRALSPEDLADLTRACDEMRVDFLLYRDCRMFPRFRNVDWI